MRPQRDAALESTARGEARRLLITALGDVSMGFVTEVTSGFDADVMPPTSVAAAVDGARYDLAVVVLGALETVGVAQFLALREGLARLPRVVVAEAACADAGALAGGSLAGVSRVGGALAGGALAGGALAGALGAHARVAREALSRETLSAAMEVAIASFEAERYSADSGERLRAVFNSMPSAVIVTDVASGNVVEVNQAALSVLEFRRYDEILGRTLGDRRPTARVLSDPSSTGERQDVSVSLPSGRSVTLGFRSTLTAAGRQLVTVFCDLTDTIEAEERRQRAEELAQVGEMAARLSHEIKNPLSSILAGLQLLELDAELNEDQREITGGVLTQARNLATTVRTLLDQSRPAPMLPRPSLLGDIVSSNVETYRSVARTDGVELEVEKPEPADDVHVLADPTWLGRALSNIVINAIEASPRGSRVEVRWGVMPLAETQERFPGFGGTAMSLRVRDFGSGMTAEELRRAFKPFFTTKERGTGLGLAVLRDVVDFHGGVIRVVTQPRSGTSMEIALAAVPPSYLLWWKSLRSCSEHCSGCSSPATNTEHSCWALRARKLGGPDADWPAKCKSCPVFLRTNLAAHAAERVQLVVEPALSFPRAAPARGRLGQ